MGSVAELWRYPASSLAGERLDAISVGSGNHRRRPHVRSRRCLRQRNRAAGPRREMAQGAAHQDPVVQPTRELEIAVPDGDWLAAPGIESDRAVSAYLGFDASIRPFREGKRGAGLFRPVDRRALPQGPDPPSDHGVTGAAEGAAPGRRPPIRAAFAPTSSSTWRRSKDRSRRPEWIGRKLAIGDLRLTISEPCRRCGFTIIAQDGFDNDPAHPAQSGVATTRHNLRRLLHGR